MKKICCLILVCLTLVQLSACGGSGKSETVKVFEEVCEQMDQVKDLTLSDAKKEKVNKKLRENLGKLGLTYYGDATLPLNQNFIDDYLTEHSPEELLSNSMKLYNYIDRKCGNYGGKSMADSSWHSNGANNCLCVALTNFMELVFKNVETNIMPITSNKGTYYKEHPDADPQPFHQKYEGYRDEDTGTVSYYGDFALLSKTLIRWDDGFIGWIDGKFIDRGPKSTTHHVYELYYKGKCILSVNHYFSPSQTRILTLNDKFYLVTYEDLIVDYTFDTHHRYLVIDSINY